MDLNASWWQSMVQAEKSQDKSLENFCLAADKELALKAAYRAMNIDPLLAPTFQAYIAREPMKENPPSSNQTVISNNSNLLPILLGAALGIGGITATSYVMEESPTTQPSQPSQPVDNQPIPNQPNNDEMSKLRHALCEEIANNPALKEKLKELFKE